MTSGVPLICLYFCCIFVSFLSEHRGGLCCPAPSRLLRVTAPLLACLGAAGFLKLERDANHQPGKGCKSHPWAALIHALSKCALLCCPSSFLSLCSAAFSNSYRGYGNTQGFSPSSVLSYKSLFREFPAAFYLIGVFSVVPKGHPGAGCHGAGHTPG